MLKRSCNVCKIVGAVAIIGALNWGLVGIAQVNPIDQMFGAGSISARWLYAIVGLAGISLLVSYFYVCPACRKAGA